MPSKAALGTTGACQPAAHRGVKSGGVRWISIVTSIGAVPLLHSGSRYTTSAL